MNPQQFQNMAGMGRGMPNMMNNVRGPPNFLQIIYQSLTQSQNVDGPFTGWRATVSIQERANQIKLLFDSLRMLSSTNDIVRSLDIALAFERKQFVSSATQEVYKQAIREKLFSIKDQRQQFVNANTNLPAGAIQITQNAGFQQREQPNQAQMSQMGQAMNFGQLGMAPSPTINQMSGQQTMNPAQAMTQQVTANANLNQQNRTAVPELSKEDNTWINARAAEMAKSTPREQMREIVESMDPRIRMNLQEKKIDPIIYHFRMKATREFRLKQQQQQQQTAANNQQNNMNMNAMRRNPTPGQTMAMPVTQPTSTTFMGHIDQIRDQQEEGMRSQQQGQLVVPASNQNTGAEVMRAQQQMIANQIRKQYPQATPHQLSQFMRQRMAQVQQQQIQRQMQANGQAGVMPSVGSGQNLNQGVSQPSMGMSTLTQPVNHPNNSPATNVTRPASRVQGPQVVGPGQQQPQPQQPQQPQTSQQQNINIAQIQHIFSRLPPALQQKLRNTPNQAEWVGIVNQWRATQSQMQRQMPPNANDMRRSASQQNTPNFQQMPNSQFSGPPPMQASLSNGAEQTNVMQNMTPMQRPVQTMNPNMPNGLQVPNQPQQRQQPMPMTAGNPMNTQDPSMKMVQALVQESENYPVPNQVLTRIQTIYMQGGIGFPQIQSWGQLKQFVKTHPNQRVQISALLQTQVQHARSVKQQAGMKQENMPGMPQGIQSQMSGGPSAMQQVAGGQGLRGPVTQQDIQRMKAQNPNYAHLSDAQVRDMLTQKLNAQKPQQAPGMVATGAPAGQTSAPATTQVQNNVRAPNQATAKTGLQSGPNRAQLSVQPPAQDQNQGQVPAPAPAVPRPNENRLKRPNQEEQLSQQQKRFDISKAEFDAFTPEQREKFLQDRKKAEAVVKMAKMRKINQDVQATMAHRRPPPIVSMDLQSRQNIIKMLTSENTKKILERFDSFLLAFDQFEKDDNMLKLLIQHRWHLMQQFKPESWANKTYQPAEHFTLQAEHIEKILSTVTAKFQQAIQKSQNQATARPQLTQENLMTAATQAAQQQKLNKKPRDGPPPAPTVDKPPFQFPDDRGRGTPKYANQGIKQEDLKLPPSKKLKAGPSAPSTPVQTSQPKPTFRCSISECTAQPQGFNTQAELEAHRNMAHQELAVKDPIGFLNSSLQQAFDLDVNLEPKKIKTEPGAASTPMTKIGSQQDGKARVQAESRGAKNGSKATESAPSDEWDDTTFTFEDLTNVFGTQDHSDAVPMQQQSLAKSMRAIEAYMETDEWKQAIGVSDSSEDSSAKSKSPYGGSEQSLPTKAQIEADKDPFHVDLIVGGNALPVLEGTFEDLLVDDDLQGGDWTMLDAEGSLSPWEKIEGLGDSEIKKDDDAWLAEFHQPIRDPFTDDEIDKLLDGEVFEAMLATNDPGVYAAGSMEWNAIGKKGEEMRRALGWPIEGAAGRAQTYGNGRK